MNAATLIIDEIRQLALDHDIDFNLRGRPQDGVALSKTCLIRLFFRKESPQAWRTLMTHFTEVQVSISGARTVTGSGQQTTFCCLATGICSLRSMRFAQALAWAMFSANSLEATSS